MKSGREREGGGRTDKGREEERESAAARTISKGTRTTMSTMSAPGKGKKKKESSRARRKRMLKERERGFDVAPRANSAKPAEYDAFKDPNMQQYFSQPHVRGELARSGLIKPIKSPVDGEDPMWVPTDMPKKIFFTKKDPIAAKREKLSISRKIKP